MPSFYNNYYRPSFADFGAEIKNNIHNNNCSGPLFEFFGLKLYLDDIIIIGIIVFLYKEGVHDELLFIVLIMLLLN